MTYRGLDPRRRLLRWGLFGVAIAVVLAATLPTALGAVSDLVRMAPDRLPWVTMRVLGFLAYSALAGSVIYGLLLSTRILDAIAHRPVSFALHKDLSAIGLGLSAVHAALLLLDRSVPFDAIQVLVPFAAPYRPAWVALGQVGIDLLAVIYASFWVRRRIGQGAWRAIHHLTFLAFAGATAHGILAGTDTATPWAWFVYAGATAAVVFLTVYRIGGAADERRSVGDSPPPPRPNPLEVRAPGA